MWNYFFYFTFRLYKLLILLFFCFWDRISLKKIWHPKIRVKSRQAPRLQESCHPWNSRKQPTPHDTPWSPEVTETEPDLFTTLQFRRAVSGLGKAIISPHDSGAQDTFFHALEWRHQPLRSIKVCSYHFEVKLGLFFHFPPLIYC